jgi:hypothetical protein
MTLPRRSLAVRIGEGEKRNALLPRDRQRHGRRPADVDGVRCNRRRHCGTVLHDLNVDVDAGVREKAHLLRIEDLRRRFARQRRYPDHRPRLRGSPRPEC